MNESDSELLQQFARESSETAFAELVRRHIDLVYSAALRQIGSDSEDAEDVAQQSLRTLPERRDGSRSIHP
jgi:DNA-directed RNA polymerase specialized sigma24 family protein